VADDNLLRIAIAQIETVEHDLAAALERHRRLIAAAREAGVELLLFPELSLAGHDCIADGPALALGADDPRLLELARLSGPMVTVLGLVEEAPGALFYDSAAALQEGRLRFLHRKVNLATYGSLEEGKLFAAGARIESFQVKGPWRAAILICADLWNPALPEIAALGGATLLLAPASSGIGAGGPDFDNPAGWELCLRWNALVLGTPIAMANRAGEGDRLRFWGGSRILDPFGRTLAEAGEAHDRLAVAELDYAAVRRARTLLPTLRDANPRLLHRELARLTGAARGDER
jgi:predicted amidohydrolase